MENDFSAQDQLNASLRDAGLHPSQTDQFIVAERGDIFPPVEIPEIKPYFYKGPIRLPPKVRGPFATFTLKLLRMLGVGPQWS